MKDATTSVTAALLGLAGFEVLAAADAGGEVEVLVETVAQPVGCPDCGALATAKDRRPVWVRDLPAGGRPVVICWVKRVWCCRESACPARTWTETHEAIAARATLTERARAWAPRRRPQRRPDSAWLMALRRGSHPGPRRGLGSRARRRPLLHP